MKSASTSLLFFKGAVTSCTEVQNIILEMTTLK